MVASRRGLVALACSPLLIAAPARAGDPATCRVINVDYTPGGIAAGPRSNPPGAPAINSPAIAPQIVAWVEKPTGEYVSTIYLTQQTGRYGMGNRPGRFDFNSGPNWPYGRRTTVFPVWSHRNHQSFPQLEFQSGQDSDLSHAFDKSSKETHFCRPLLTSEALWDAVTCSSSVYTDKGRFGAETTGYPPRADVTPVAGMDSPSVGDYKAMNPFDAVSQATPAIGALTQISWPIPADLATGGYVLFMEVSLEQDFNAIYNPTSYPSPMGISYGNYGVPYRGQPSVIYKVPFTVGDLDSTSTVDTWEGYGDPDGAATLHPRDATITADTPNTGASRLLLTSKDGQLFRVRVVARTERDVTPPGTPGDMVVTAAVSRGATLQFTAPGDDGFIGSVQGYDVHYVVGEATMTDTSFAAASPAHVTGDIVAAGQPQTLTIADLLPETEYTVAVRAYDNCRNTSKITQTTFTTAPRATGQVDACFVATAAYGSLLANDVEMLRHFRDALLKHSVLGELAVETYYTFGPPVAGVVGESDLLRSTARDALTPLVSWVRGLR